MPDENGRRLAGDGSTFSLGGGGLGEWVGDLSAVYPFQPGCRYTVISAVNVAETKKLILPPSLAPGIVVAKPQEFTMPEGEFNPRPGSGFIGHDEKETPKPKPKPPSSLEPPGPPPPTTFDQQWQQASRFAGKPFDGLLLTALAGQPAEVTISLKNRSREAILVTKWKGESDYEVLVRDRTGKPAHLTEKGNRFFTGGNLLEFRELKPGEALETTLRLSGLFSVTPGEYEVLVSLPVVGDVDAVLTAAPVKIHFP